MIVPIIILFSYADFLLTAASTTYRYTYVHTTRVAYKIEYQTTSISVHFV